MNIAFFSIVPLKYFKEATTLTILNNAKELRKLGHKVVIIAEKTAGLAGYEEIEGVPVYRLYSKGKILSFVLGLREIQKKLGLKFDVIHSFSATPLFVLSGVVSKVVNSKAKLIHSMKSYSRRKSDKYFFPLLNLMHVVTVPTEIHKQKLQGVKKNKVAVIRSPINTEKFGAKNKTEKEELKEKYGYKNKKMILYYGSFHEHKGVDNVLYAIPELEHKELKVVLLPRYTEISKERKIVEDLGIQKVVEFITEDVKIEDYVSMADVVVLPYNSLIATDGNPSCMIEAMASKTAVVTADLPELKEVGEDCIVTTDVKNKTLLAQTIKRVLEDADQGMMERAYMAAQEFNGAKIAEKLVRLYEDKK